MAMKDSVKSIILIGAAFILGGGIGFGVTKLASGGSSAITSGEGSVSLELYPEAAEAVGDDWILKIDDYAIRKSDFDLSFEMVKEQLTQLVLESYGLTMTDDELKEIYLEEMLPSYILAIRALDEGVLNDDETMTVFIASMQQQIATLYLESMLPEDENYFDPSTVEIDQAFQLYQTQLLASGMSSTEINDYLTMVLQQQKLQQWQQSVIDDIQLEYRVIKNNDYLDTTTSDFTTDLALPVME